MFELLGVPPQVLMGQLLLGLINGSFYAVLSLGLAVIFGLLNIINFAHGAQYMMGAFAAWMLLAMPLAGMGMRQLAGKETELFWLFSVPQFTEVNMDLAKQVAWIHKDFLWTSLLVLVAIHVAGALWHHLIDKDATLRRMLPGRR